MSKRFKLIMLALVMSLAMILTACGGGSGDKEDATNNNNNNNNAEQGDSDQLELGQKKLTIPYVAWARETLSTHMLANLLEQVGYEVDMKQVEAGPMFSSIADGSADFHTSAWLPATHQSYWEKYENDIEKVTEVLDKAPLALTVPSYVEDINTMDDLKTNEQFGDSVNWTITGIDPGAGITQNTEIALEEYGLDKWKIQSSSEAAMLAELRKAIDRQEPIIVPLWKPHWAFGDMDLKMLEDPKEIYGGEGDQIYTVARKGLKEDAPRAYKVLQQYVENYEMLDEMMPKVYVDEVDPAEVVQEFIDNNPNLLDQWLDGVPRK